MSNTPHETDKMRPGTWGVSDWNVPHEKWGSWWLESRKVWSGKVEKFRRQTYNCPKTSTTRMPEQSTQTMSNLLPPTSLPFGILVSSMRGTCSCRATATVALEPFYLLCSQVTLKAGVSTPHTIWRALFTFWGRMSSDHTAHCPQVAI